MAEEFLRPFCLFILLFFVADVLHRAGATPTPTGGLSLPFVLNQAIDDRHDDGGKDDANQNRLRHMRSPLLLLGKMLLATYQKIYQGDEKSRGHEQSYEITDAWGSFQSGDSFIVYPSKDGKPLDSLRHEVLFEGLQDYAALKMLEEKIGRDAVVKMIDNAAGRDLRFDDYPRGKEFLENLRAEMIEKIN